MRFLFVVLPSLMVLGCATYVPPPPPPPPPLPLPPPPKPVPTVPQWTSKSDNTAENYDCLSRTACPRTMVERARRRAAIAFKCSADQISTTARPAQGLSYQNTTMQLTAQGNVQIAVKSSKPADAFDVSGCGQKGILVCVWANRSVRTPDTTYENTADRLCLWADRSSF